MADPSLAPEHGQGHRRAKDEAPDPDHVGVHEAVADAVPIKAPPHKHITVRVIETPAVRIRSNA
jgi:hypothetical protein